jgi:hypothetical protein
LLLADSFFFCQLKIWRVVDPNSTDALHPGMVTAYNVRQKLSRQLKIDLEDHETVHLLSDAPMVNSDYVNNMDDNKIQDMVDEFEPPQGGSCQIKIKRLGEYLAKLRLDGGYSVPIKIVVQQRIP